MDCPDSDCGRSREPELGVPSWLGTSIREDHYLGHLLTNNSYDLVEADWYRVGHSVFFVIADVAGVTGTNLTAGHANIVELTGSARAFGTGSPADIDDVADAGSGSTVSHYNHVHRLQTDSTLAFDGSGVLGATSTASGTAVDAVVMNYSDGTRTLSIDVQQDNGTDIPGSQILPVASQVRFGLAETATDTEAAAASSDAVVLTPGNLPSVNLSDLDEADRLCPDPSTGSSGQVCSRNTAGTSYELNKSRSRS